MSRIVYYVKTQEPWVKGYRPWASYRETTQAEDALRHARERLLAGFNFTIHQKEEAYEPGT